MSAKELKVINPFDESVYTTLPMLGEGDVDGVVRRARAAFEQWRWTSHAERRALCEAFMGEFSAAGDRIAADITGQMGKPLSQARNEVY